jgi:hypothetical protein
MHGRFEIVFKQVAGLFAASFSWQDIPPNNFGCNMQKNRSCHNFNNHFSVISRAVANEALNLM